MRITLLSIITTSALLFSGCASVPTESVETSNALKQFNTPAANTAGLYVYRKGGMGQSLKKDLWVDGVCLGQSAPNVFFYKEVTGDTDHTITTQSEFGNNDLVVPMQSGENYFVKQYIKPGVFVGGANLKLMDKEQAQQDLQKLDLATQGTCRKTNN